jgi:hypothetical protein
MMIGRQLESDTAGASRRYENPRDAYDHSIRQFGCSTSSRRRFVLPESGDVRCRRQRDDGEGQYEAAEGERAEMPR